MIEFNDKCDLGFDLHDSERMRYEYLTFNKDSVNANTSLSNADLVEEIPAAITVNDISHAVMMITPCNLESFAIGFVFSEGLIQSASDIRDIEIKKILLDYGYSLSINVTLSPERFFNYKKSRKAHLGATGCGLCGVESLEHAFPSLTNLKACEPISFALLPKLRQTLFDLQALGQKTGAIHGALLLSPEGEVLSCMEDIGRHNALDKVIGYALSKDIHLFQCSVVLSSRCSTELVQKAVKAGLSRLIHLSSPSNMAVTMARQLGLQLIHLPKHDEPRQYSPLALKAKP